MCLQTVSLHHQHQREQTCQRVIVIRTQGGKSDERAHTHTHTHTFAQGKHADMPPSPRRPRGNRTFLQGGGCVLPDPASKGSNNTEEGEGERGERDTERVGGRDKRERRERQRDGRDKRERRERRERQERETRERPERPESQQRETSGQRLSSDRQCNSELVVERLVLFG